MSDKFGKFSSKNSDSAAKKPDEAVDFKQKNLRELLRISAQPDLSAELRAGISLRAMEIISRSSQEELKTELEKLLLEKASCTKKHFIEKIDSNAIRDILREMRSAFGLDYAPFYQAVQDGRAKNLSDEKKMELLNIQSEIVNKEFYFNKYMGKVISSLKKSRFRKKVNKT